jgi:hypothetical protein
VAVDHHRVHEHSELLSLLLVAKLEPPTSQSAADDQARPTLSRWLEVIRIVKEFPHAILASA